MATVVVGATGAVGRAVAQRCAAAVPGGGGTSPAAPLVLVARGAGPLEALADELRMHRHVSVRVVAGDAATAETVQAAIEAAGGSVARLVWAAGAGKSGAVQSFTDEDWRRMCDANAGGPIRFVRECLRADATRGLEGGVAFVSSILARRPVKFDAAYGTTKAAVASFARALHEELAWTARKASSPPPAVLCLTPSFIEGAATDRSVANLLRRQNDRWSGGPEKPTEASARRRIAESCPGGRILRAAEVADAVVYAIATDEGRRWCAEELRGEPLTLRGLPPVPDADDGGAAIDAEVLGRRIDGTVEWLRSTAGRHARGGLVVPLSGGTDSAVAFALACRALGPDRVHGIHFTATSGPNPQPSATTAALLDFVGGDPALRGATVAMHPLDRRADADDDSLRWAIANTAARRRGAWLAGTRNRTEHVMGTYSVVSAAATTQPLLNWWKREVMAAAAGPLRVPTAIVASSHAADPDCGRPADVAAIGIGKLDWFARCTWAGQPWRLTDALSPAEIGYLRGISAYNSFKRSMPADPSPWHERM